MMMRETSAQGIRKRTCDSKNISFIPSSSKARCPMVSSALRIGAMTAISLRVSGGDGPRVPAEVVAESAQQIEDYLNCQNAIM